jgi:hypothetical protein
VRLFCEEEGDACVDMKRSMGTSFNGETMVVPLCGILMLYPRLIDLDIVPGMGRSEIADE